MTVSKSNKLCNLYQVELFIYLLWSDEQDNNSKQNFHCSRVDFSGF